MATEGDEYTMVDGAMVREGLGLQRSDGNHQDPIASTVCELPSGKNHQEGWLLHLLCIDLGPQFEKVLGRFFYLL